LIYPYLLGFDAVILEADAQIGGTDQTFNMLMGRTLRQKLANEVQLVMTVPLIEGTDGRKMSKSYNNTINLIDTPNDIFGKIMSAKDEIIVTYFTLLTDVSNSELDQIKKDVQAHPKEQKINLAKNIISQIYGLEEANLAEEHFHKVFVKKEIPDDIPTKKISQFKGQNISDVLVKLGLVSSKSEAVRLIDQGGVTFRSKKVETGEYLINETGIIQVGKRKFINLIKG
jgi:tyrosyl-tRNA synthetase